MWALGTGFGDVFESDEGWASLCRFDWLLVPFNWIFQPSQEPAQKGTGVATKC
jgi:hypothetical protein